MKQQNRSNQRNSKWSAVDTVILLLILLAVAGLIYRMVSVIYRERHQEEAQMYAVYFEVDEMHKNELDSIRGFDTVYLKEPNQRLGYIGVYADEAEGHQRVAISKVSDSETRSDYLSAEGCMICADAEELNGGILVRGTNQYLTSGSELVICTDRVQMTVRITKITPHA